MTCTNATDEQIDAACELLPNWSECESCTGNDSSGYSKNDGCVKFCVDGQIYFGISLTDEPNKDHPLLGSKKTTPTWFIGTICDFFINRMEFVGVTDDIKACCADLKSKIDHLIADQKNCCSQLNTKIDSLQSDVSEIKTDVKSIKTDVTEIKIDVSSIKTTVEGIDNKVDSISNTVNTIADGLCTKSDCDAFNAKLDIIDDKIDALGSGGDSGCTAEDCAVIKQGVIDANTKLDDLLDNNAGSASSGYKLVWEGNSGKNGTSSPIDLKEKGLYMLIVPWPYDNNAVFAPYNGGLVPVTFSSDFIVYYHVHTVGLSTNIVLPNPQYSASTPRSSIYTYSGGSVIDLTIDGGATGIDARLINVIAAYKVGYV